MSGLTPDGPQSLKYLQPVSCPREMKALLRPEGLAGVSWESGGGQCSRWGQRANPKGEKCPACMCEGKQRLEEEEGQWAQDLNFSWRTSNSAKLTQPHCCSELPSVTSHELPGMWLEANSPSPKLGLLLTSALQTHPRPCEALCALASSSQPKVRVPTHNLPLFLSKARSYRLCYLTKALKPAHPLCLTSSPGSQMLPFGQILQLPHSSRLTTQMSRSAPGRYKDISGLVLSWTNPTNTRGRQMQAANERASHCPLLSQLPPVGKAPPLQLPLPFYKDSCPLLHPGYVWP